MLHINDINYITEKEIRSILCNKNPEFSVNGCNEEVTDVGTYCRKCGLLLSSAGEVPKITIYTKSKRDLAPAFLQREEFYKDRFKIIEK